MSDISEPTKRRYDDLILWDEAFSHGYQCGLARGAILGVVVGVMFMLAVLSMVPWHA